MHDDAGRLDEARQEYERALALPARPGKYLSRVYLNLALVAQKKGDYKVATLAAKNVLVAERAFGQETDKSRQARELLMHKE